MKKILIISILLSIISFRNILGYQKTGHPGFSEINFTTTNAKLLSDVSTEELNDAYKKMGKGRFWGWQYFYFSLNAKASYVGDVIFSKSNRTDSPFVISYQVQEKEYAERSVSSTGNVAIKASGNYKKIVDGSIEGKYGYSSSKLTSSTFTETSKIDFEVKPYHSLIYRVCGEAEVTTCACRYYVFGILFKKGAYEVVTVMTSYYELKEEIIEGYEDHVLGLEDTK